MKTTEEVKEKDNKQVPVPKGKDNGSDTGTAKAKAKPSASVSHDAEKPTAGKKEQEDKAKEEHPPKKKRKSEDKKEDDSLPVTKSPKSEDEGETIAVKLVQKAEMEVKIQNGHVYISAGKVEFPVFRSGDTVTVHYKILEGNKVRIQQFQGVVIQRKGSYTTETCTIRKVSDGVGVERIFPLHSPFIDKIVVNKRGNVRRARIFYLKNLKGKKARIEEKGSSNVL